MHFVPYLKKKKTNKLLIRNIVGSLFNYKKYYNHTLYRYFIFETVYEYGWYESDPIQIIKPLF